MANLFSDIFEAIRTIRQKKGTKETDIMTYVHDRLGKGVSIRTVLKTMKTLNRLVDDGLLIRKGCRYLLPLPCDSGQDKSDDNGDDCMEEDDDDDNNDEGEDEDEGEEDEDDDDDDDDDDEECNMDEDEIKANDNGNGDQKDPCKMDEDVVEPRGRRNENPDLNCKNIDSKMKTYMKSELNPVAGSFMRSKKQRHGVRRNHVYDEEYDDLSQTRSPAGKSSDEIELMMDVEEGLHESQGGAQFINSDLSFGYEKGDRPEGYNEYRYKGPNGSPPPNTPGVHVERRESCCSDIVLKVGDLAEAEPNMRGDAKSKQPEERDKKQTTKDRQPKRRARDESEEGCKKEKALRRDNSADKPKNDKKSSICDLCKKKKPPGYEVDCGDNAGNW